MASFYPTVNKLQHLLEITVLKFYYPHKETDVK